MFNWEPRISRSDHSLELSLYGPPVISLPENELGNFSFHRMVTPNQIASATQALGPDWTAAFATICGQHSSYRWHSGMSKQRHIILENFNKLFLAAYLLDVSYRRAFEMMISKGAMYILTQAGPGLVIFARIYCIVQVTNSISLSLLGIIYRKTRGGGTL